MTMRPSGFRSGATQRRSSLVAIAMVAMYASTSLGQTIGRSPSINPYGGFPQSRTSISPGGNMANPYSSFPPSRTSISSGPSAPNINPYGGFPRQAIVPSRTDATRPSSSRSSSSGFGGSPFSRSRNDFSRHHDFSRFCDGYGKIPFSSCFRFCKPNWCNTSSSLFFVGYPYYYPSYGLSSYYDPYLGSIEDENARLRDQVEELRRQRDDAIDRNGVRVDVPLRKRNGDPAAERRREQNERANQYIVAGSRLFSSGNYLKAAERFREAARLSPDDATPHFYLAQALFASRRYSEAVQSIKNGLKVNTDWLELDFDVTTLYGQGDSFVEQLAQLAGRIQANPLDREALFLLGYELFVSNQKDKSLPLFEQSARLEADDSHVKPFFDYFEKARAAGVAPAGAGVPDPPLPKARSDAQARKQDAPAPPVNFPGITLPNDL